MIQEKPVVTMIVLGHVDSGKSTVTGHLLYKLGKFPKASLDAISTELNRTFKNGDSYKYAWILDTLRVERERGITINLKYNSFETTKFRVTIIDAPGHRDYIKNMLTGTSQADVACLVIDCTPSVFESGWENQGQAKEHALLAYTLGVKQLVVVLNKLDLCDYAEARYDEVKARVGEYLVKVGFKAKRVHFVPVSAFHGENLVERSAKMSWYNGPVLVAAFNALEAPTRVTDKPLRIPIQASYRVLGIGTVIVGRIESGSAELYQELRIVPGNIRTEMKSIEYFGESLSTASTGTGGGMSLMNVRKKEASRGHVASGRIDPAIECIAFEAQVILLGQARRIRVGVGYTPVMFCHTQSVATRFTAIHQSMDRITGKVIEKNPKLVRAGEAFLATLTPVKPTVVETFDAYPSLGRFALRDLSATIGVGVIKSVQRRIDEKQREKGAGRQK